MNYDKYPETRIAGFDDQAWQGWPEISHVISQLPSGSDYTLCVECYPGVHKEVFNAIAAAYKPDAIIDANQIFYANEKLNQMMQPHLTDDRVRGVMFYGTMLDFVDAEKLAAAKAAADSTGRFLIYGTGASLISNGDTLIYCDLARWEIQLRYRAGMPNFNQTNYNEDVLRKIKRGYFVEWRIADKLKKDLFGEIDYLLDSNTSGRPVMVTGESFRAALKQIASQPFRLVPYFDPGVWGGQWMKKVCGLSPAEKNYAWSFDGVPEENSVYLRFGKVRLEIPAMDLVLYQPKELLGVKNYARFGAEFPIRFDFLDTMDGQNLSLQVHPLTDFIRSHYGMSYTQDESYYILDCKEDGGVFLGLKERIDPAAMAQDLKSAAAEEISFPADQYVNFFPAEKHDHFLIPAGTVHCSSKNCMVLEISATPYIFTFKLWDWNRLGLDGRPRPIHINEGLTNIQWDRTTAWVKDNLVNQIQLLNETDLYREEKTGLHELEFIETRRFTSRTKLLHSAEQGVHVLNLVEGSEAVVESPSGMFKPFKVHYAETFIIPAKAGEYTIEPGAGETEIKYIQASVRN